MTKPAELYIPDHSKLTPAHLMPKPEPKIAHLKVSHPKNGTHHTAYGPSGTVFWETPTKARELLNTGAFELMNKPQSGEPRAAKPGAILKHHAGWPLDRFSEVLSLWRDDVAVCIAGGPSLTPEQCQMVRDVGCRAIAINDGYRIAPWADICYFADSRWWDWHKDKPEFHAFEGQKCTIYSTGMLVEDAEIHMLRNGGREGLCLDPSQIATGQNSGYQALNIAVHSGAKTILMLGYDAREPIPGKPNHWFGEHPIVEPVGIYDIYRKSMREIAPLLKGRGVRVINCSPGSAINAFEQMPLADALALERGK